MDSPWRLCAVAAGLLAVAGCTEQAPKLLTWSPAPAPQRVVVNPNAPAAARPYFVPGTGASGPPAAEQRPDMRYAAAAAKRAPAVSAGAKPGLVVATLSPPAAAQNPGAQRPAAPAAALGPVARNPASVILKRGETLYDVARRYHVPLRLLLDANQLSPPYRALAGRRLVLPKPPTHRVRPGETLYGLSRRYHVGLYELVSANDIPPPYRIETGTVLVIPPPAGGPPAPPLRTASAPKTAPRPTAVASRESKPPPPRPVPRAMPAPATRPVQRAAKPRLAARSAPQRLLDRHGPVHPVPDHQEATRREPAPAPAAARQSATRPAPRPAPQANQPPARTRPFLWPVQGGRVLVGFGPEQDGLSNDGINIAVPEGTPVRAAASGVVVYAGNELRGYGDLLLIRHADGWITAYAHNAKLLVRRGQRVARGEIIARAGETGGVSSPQLHFEIRYGARPVNPLHYLSALREPRTSGAG